MILDFNLVLIVSEGKGAHDWSAQILRSDTKQVLAKAKGYLRKESAIFQVCTDMIDKTRPYTYDVIEMLYKYLEEEKRNEIKIAVMEALTENELGDCCCD